MILIWLHGVSGSRGKTASQGLRVKPPKAKDRSIKKGTSGQLGPRGSLIRSIIVIIDRDNACGWGEGLTMRKFRTAGVVVPGGMVWGADVQGRREEGKGKRP